MKEDEFRLIGEAVGMPLQGHSRATHRILVVDDEPVLRRLMSAALTGSGYYVDNAEDGAIAWRALQAKPYDLLITDHMMPKITGVELVKSLRSARMALPVVMVAGVLPAHELSSLNLAATLSKPFIVAELLDTVDSVLRPTMAPWERTRPHWRNQPSASGLWL
jgi:DNA-binding response OmpR family regulator